ncbi:unnamed protein product [Callosobruchus maculatus]|uniref:Uncharacterized protein n=1 Tax=Callosobruchus maculatus TaxID=64391 RepID=A0A653CR34_CALMS|nr:unnamed protein product [Callosobruchus maculatus]
MGLSAGAY